MDTSIGVDYTVNERVVGAANIQRHLIPHLHSVPMTTVLKLIVQMSTVITLVALAVLRMAILVMLTIDKVMRKATVFTATDRKLIAFVNGVAELPGCFTACTTHLDQSHPDRRGFTEAGKGVGADITAPAHLIMM